MADYRVILLFKAETDEAATAAAKKGAMAVGGKVDRLTARGETWTAVKSEK